VVINRRLGGDAFGSARYCGLVLVMSVNPGFGGQKFIPSTLHKNEELAEIRAARGYSYRIECRCGVGMDTVAQVVQRGGDSGGGECGVGRAMRGRCGGAAGRGAEC